MNARTGIAAAVGTALLLMLALVGAGQAQAGTYVVRECQHSAPQNHSHEALATVSPSPGPYDVFAGSSVCSSAVDEYSIQTAPTATALQGQYGLARFVAPDGTKIIGVQLAARLRSEAGHRARLSMANAAGVERVRFGAGSAGPAGFSLYQWPMTPGAGAYQQFTAGLVCDNPGSFCSIAQNGDRSKADIRNVKLTIRDDVPPTVSLGGGLVDGGWIRRSATLLTDVDDRGGGLRAVTTIVNGSVMPSSLVLPCAFVEGTREGRRMSPCQAVFGSFETVNTADGPYVDGENDYVVCAIDFGDKPNQDCEARTISVDNAAPNLSFRSGRDSSDPELIALNAADPTSGLDTDTAQVEVRPNGSDDAWTQLPTRMVGGELTARVDSASPPPGDYEFRASIIDVAGNKAETARREDGEPMILRFPLKTATELRAALENGEDNQVVRYRKDGEIRGRLLDASGQPIPRQAVTVTEAFEEGSLIDTRQRTVETDARGYYRSTLPGGPSRNVSVRYMGSRRYSGDMLSGLDFDVRGAAQLKISKRRVKAGRPITFKGRVKRYFARIPAGGKLVEVQVKSGNGWTTLHEATGTDRKGRVALRHRFRGFYTRPVTFVFRLKATRENGWPYRGAAKSHRQRVTVVPR